MSNGRTIVIGDIHNAYLALKQLIEEKIKPTKEDTLIFIGDYVDGWSDCINTLQYLMQLWQEYNCIGIMGNHDSDWGLIGFLKTGRANPPWLKHGGQVTYDALQDEFMDNPMFADELMMWTNKLVNKYIDEDNRLFVHGGFQGKTAEGRHSHPHDLMWNRSLITNAVHQYMNDGDAPRQCKVYKEIYIGHTSTVKFGLEYPDSFSQCDILNVFNIWNVDTGAGFAGRLSAIDIDTKEVYSSDKVRTFYPEEYQYRLKNDFKQ